MQDLPIGLQHYGEEVFGPLDYNKKYTKTQVFPSIISLMDLPVNNYLKSTDEIEAEFRFVAHSDKSNVIEMETPFATYGRIRKMAESHSPFQLADLDLASPLEENY